MVLHGKEWVVWLLPQRTLPGSGDFFTVTVGSTTAIWWAETGAAATHSTAHKIVPITKKVLAPNVESAEIEESHPGVSATLHPLQQLVANLPDGPQ